MGSWVKIVTDFVPATNVYLTPKSEIMVSFERHDFWPNRIFRGTQLPGNVPDRSASNKNQFQSARDHASTGERCEISLTEQICGVDLEAVHSVALFVTQEFKKMLIKDSERTSGGGILYPRKPAIVARTFNINRSILPRDRILWWPSTISNQGMFVNRRRYVYCDFSFEVLIRPETGKIARECA